MFKRRNIILNLLLICVLATVGFFGYRALYPTVAPEVLRTSPVTIGDVVTTVSASGSVQSTSDIGLTFKTIGIVQKVNVKVGDKVSAGKLLAYIDDSPAKLALLQAKSSLKSAELSVLQAQQSQESADLSVLTSQDALDNLLAGPTTETKDSQAQALYNSRLAVTVAEENVTKAVSDIAQNLYNSRLAVTVAEENVTKAVSDIAQQEIAAATNLAGYSRAIARAIEDNARSTAASARSLEDAQLAQTAGILRDATTTATLKSVLATAKRNLDTAKYNLAVLESTQALDATNTAKRNLDTAKYNLAVLESMQADANKPATTVAIASAKQSVASAKRSQQSAAISLKQSEITIANAQATLINAQANLDGTKILAPVSGTIAAIATPAGVNAGSTTAGSGGVAGYIILTDLNSLQVKASVAEADVVTLQVGQSADFTFDALSSVRVSGTVISVAPVNNASTGAGSVMSYTVLFSLDSNPEGVKPGMTSQVSVVTAQSLGVLNIPSTAVTQIGRAFTVTLKPKADGEAGERVNVEVGLQGDSRTEILSGLKEGDEVVLRSVTSSGSNGFPTGGIPGAGNGGGGGRGGN